VAYLQVRKGKDVKDFFTIPEYEQWLEDVPDSRKWAAKYYKVWLFVFFATLVIMFSRVLERARTRMHETTSAIWQNI